MKEDLAEGIKRVAKALNKHEVEYMFVGGVAISFYGNPRPSLNLPKDVEYDIDVWYQATNDNFIKLIGGEIDGVKFNVISKSDLLLDKEKLAWDKDLADLENLKKNSYKGFAR